MHTHTNPLCLHRSSNKNISQIQILHIFEDDIVSTQICSECRSSISEFNEFYNRILQLQSVYFKNPAFLKPQHECDQELLVERKCVHLVDESNDGDIKKHEITNNSEVDDQPYHQPEHVHVECKLECESDVDEDGKFLST